MWLALDENWEKAIAQYESGAEEGVEVAWFLAAFRAALDGVLGVKIVPKERTCDPAPKPRNQITRDRHLIIPSLPSSSPYYTGRLRWALPEYGGQLSGSVRFNT